MPEPGERDEVDAEPFCDEGRCSGGTVIILFSGCDDQSELQVFEVVDEHRFGPFIEGGLVLRSAAESVRIG